MTEIFVVASNVFPSIVNSYLCRITL
jgi:hypothetical protein